MLTAAWTAYWKGLLKLILFMPALLLYKTWIGSELHLALWIGILSLYYLAGFLFRAVWPLTSTGLYGLVSILIIAGTGFLLFDSSFTGLMQVALCGVLFFRGGFLVILGWGEPVSPNLYWISLFLYFLSSIMYRFYELTESLVPLVNMFGIATLLITMFAINRYLLSEASLLSNQEKFRPAPSLIFANLKIISAISILVLLVGISGFFGSIWAQIWDRIRITSQPQRSSAPGDEPITSDPLGSRSGREDPALWLQFLDAVLQVVGIIALILLSAAFLYFIVKKTLSFTLRIWRRLKRVILGGTDSVVLEGESAYLEEQKSLWDWERVKPWSGKLAQALKPGTKQRWNDLQTNGERVRFLFRAWINELVKSGTTYRKQDTPAEFVRKYQMDDLKEFVGLYYRVRYGKYKPTDQEVLFWKNRIKN